MGLYIPHFLILSLALRSIDCWDFLDIPEDRKTNCVCVNTDLCEVVYVNPKTVKSVETDHKSPNFPFNGTYVQMANGLGAGLQGSVFQKGTPSNIEPCPKSTQGERQFHRIISKALVKLTKDTVDASEKSMCCHENAASCQKVILNQDLFDQKTPESLFLGTSIAPGGKYDPKTAQIFKFKQRNQLTSNSWRKVYNKNLDVLTLQWTNGVRTADITKYGEITAKLSYCELFDASYYMTFDLQPKSYSAKPSLEDLFGINKDEPQSPVITQGGRVGEADCPEMTEDYCELQEDIYVDIGLDGENNGVQIEDCYERGILYEGDDFQGAVTKTSLELCKNSCTGGTCKYFVYYPDTQLCQRKSTMGGRSKDSSVISGTHKNKCQDKDKDKAQAWCADVCKNTPNCTSWTWTDFRGEPMCYGMTDCQHKVDQCFTDGHCKSGQTPGNCDESMDKCEAIIDHGPEYLDWQCHDKYGNPVDGYDTTAKVAHGTTCVQSCDSWRAHGSTKSQPIEAHLKSVCVDGAWTETEPYWPGDFEGNNGRGTLLYPQPSLADNTRYPKPDASKTDSLKCACETLELRWPTSNLQVNLPEGLLYDPNTEDINSFLCQTDNDKNNPGFVESGDSCTLFCDTYFVAPFRCWNGKWTGKPELGVWCQNNPDETNGPTKLQALTTLGNGVLSSKFAAGTGQGKCKNKDKDDYCSTKLKDDTGDPPHSHPFLSYSLNGRTNTSISRVVLYNVNEASGLSAADAVETQTIRVFITYTQPTAAEATAWIDTKENAFGVFTGMAVLGEVITFDSSSNNHGNYIVVQSQSDILRLAEVYVIEDVSA